MITIANFLITPISSHFKRKRTRNNSSALDAPPPPIDTTKEWEFGKYCWKATVQALNPKTGQVDRTFIGYSQDMSITSRTETACDRHKKKGTECGEPQMVMKGGECDEVIHMKFPNGKMINLSNPFF